MNRADNTNGNWNPQDVETTIEFRGMQAKYTFPVGVTTLWWYAPELTSAELANSTFATTGRKNQIVADAFVQTNDGPVKSAGKLRFSRT